ncbi:MAG: class I SAM-dependent methyltransferase [Ginsengibacter sp.]
MYSRLQLAKKYIYYFFTAANGKGHGTHSPFVYKFITDILNDSKKYPEYETIEHLRKKLLQEKTSIEVQDYGAGSRTISTKNRFVNDIAGSSLKPRKFAQLLFRMVRYFESKNILELGTSLGITTCYLASAIKKSKVITLEGSPSIAAIAGKNFQKVNLGNIELIEGNFDNTIHSALSIIDSVDLAFVDGNHTKKATLNYFSALLKKCDEKSIFVFDDIHWSEEMEQAWDQIKNNVDVTLTIDLFFIGIVFFNKDFKVKQHFTIRF